MCEIGGIDMNERKRGEQEMQMQAKYASKRWEKEMIGAKDMEA